MKRVLSIARGRAGRAGLVAGVLVAAVVGLAGPAGANTGHVQASQTCEGWSVTVTLDNNVTSDHFVEVTTTIPGTSGIVDAHYTTTGNSGTTQIWSASGATVQSGTVTLTILNPDKSLDSTASASLPAAGDCDTTTTQVTTTTQAHDNRCDANHPDQGQDDPQGHNNPDCDTTTTTAAPTTTTTYPVTTTTEHHCGCTTSTTQPETTTTQGHCECTTCDDHHAGDDHDAARDHHDGEGASARFDHDRDDEHDAAEAPHTLDGPARREAPSWSRRRHRPRPRPRSFPTPVATPPSR